MTEMEILFAWVKGESVNRFFCATSVLKDASRNTDLWNNLLRQSLIFRIRIIESVHPHIT